MKANVGEESSNICKYMQIYANICKYAQIHARTSQRNWDGGFVKYCSIVIASTYFATESTSLTSTPPSFVIVIVLAPSYFLIDCCLKFQVLLRPLHHWYRLIYWHWLINIDSSLNFQVLLRPLHDPTWLFLELLRHHPHRQLLWVLALFWLAHHFNPFSLYPCPLSIRLGL